MLHQHGLCPHPVTIVRKAKQLRDNHGREALEWKKSTENAEKKLLEFRSLHSTLKEAMYVEQPPLTELTSLLAEKKSESKVREEQPGIQHHDFEILDVNGLDFTCLASKKSASAVFREHAGNFHSEESVIKCFEEPVAIGEKEGISEPVEACDVAIKTLPETMPHGYQIIGDNLDLHVNVKQTSNDNKNKSIHTFNTTAIADEVSGKHVPEYHQSALEDISVADFLPSCEDKIGLKEHLIP